MSVGRWVMRTAVEFFCTCWPPAPEALNTSIFEVVGPDLDLDVVRDLGHDLHQDKGGVAPVGLVKGRQPHQAVDAPLGGEIAIGIGAIDADASHS